MLTRPVWLPVALGLLLVTARAAYAQFAVIDVASLSQLVSEAQMLQQQLTQAQTEYQSITGARGMGQLLAGTPRNYLPPDWPTLQATLQGSGGYPQLAADLQGATSAAAVLSAQQLATLSPAASAQLQARVDGEQGMLQNEQTKQQVLYQGVQAQDWANAQRMRELAVAGHGEFQNRFQPQP